ATPGRGKRGRGRGEPHRRAVLLGGRLARRAERAHPREQRRAARAARSVLAPHPSPTSPEGGGSFKRDVRGGNPPPVPAFVPERERARDGGLPRSSTNRVQPAARQGEAALRGGGPGRRRPLRPRRGLTVVSRHLRPARSPCAGATLETLE